MALYTNRVLPRTAPKKTVQGVAADYQSQRGITQAATGAALALTDWKERYDYKKDADALSAQAVTQKAQHQRGLLDIRKSVQVDPKTGKETYTFDGQPYDNLSDAEWAANSAYFQAREDSIAQIQNDDLRRNAQEAFDADVAAFSDSEGQRLMAQMDEEFVRSTGKAYSTLYAAGEYKQAEALLKEAIAGDRVKEPQAKQMRANVAEAHHASLMEGYEAAVAEGKGDKFILGIINDKTIPLEVRDKFRTEASQFATTNASTIKRMESERKAQLAKDNAQFISEFYYRLKTNQATQSDIDKAYANETIDAQQHGTLSGELANHNKAETAANDQLADTLWRNSTGGVDRRPNTPEQRKIVEASWNRYVEATGMNLEDQGREVMSWTIGNGIVPPPYAADMERNLGSTKPDDVVAASLAIGQLLEGKYTATAARQAFSTDTTRAKALFISSAIHAEMDPETALKAWNNRVEYLKDPDSPEYRQIQENVDERSEKYSVDTLIDDKTGASDWFADDFHLLKKWWPDEVKAENLPAVQKAGYWSDIMTRYETLMMAGMSEPEAWADAHKMSPWGLTNVNGTPELVPFPLEKHGVHAVEEWESIKPQGAKLIYDPYYGKDEYPILFPPDENGLVYRYENGRPLTFKPGPPPPVKPAEPVKRITPAGHLTDYVRETETKEERDLRLKSERDERVAGEIVGSYGRNMIGAEEKLYGRFKPPPKPANTASGKVKRISGEHGPQRGARSIRQHGRYSGKVKKGGS